MLVRVVFLFAFLLMASVPVSAETRLALVVGNADYRQTTKLDNAVNDARLVAGTLRAQRFDVSEYFDADLRQMRRALRSFFEKVERVGKDAVVLVYYAGHGVQVRGSNYLIPVDAEIDSESGVSSDAIRTDDVMQEIANLGTRLNIVILDACRNNPFRGFRAVTRGLAQIDAPTGTLVAFSTAPGRVTRDGPKGGNSPYTAALAKTLAEPGLRIEDVFKRVRQTVSADTKGEQVPWESSSLVGDFYPAGKVADAATPSAIVPPAAGTTLVPPAASTTLALPLPPVRQSEAAEAWAHAKDSGSAEELEWFIQRYGDTWFGDLAKARLAALRREPEQLGRAEAHAKADADAKRRTDEAAVAERRKKEAAEVEAKRRDPVAALVPGSGQSARDCWRQGGREQCGPEMVAVPAGTFRMGSPDDEKDRDRNEGPVRTVTVGQPFAVGRFEVTFAEWEECVTGGGCQSNKSPRDEGWGRGRRPVINVSWNDAQDYVAWLAKASGRPYRLLTEAEWEYAVRGVTSAQAPHPVFHFGDDEALLRQHAWFTSNSNGRTQEVGQKRANIWGLQDMHGNAWEWVEDCWIEHYRSGPTDASARTTNCADNRRRVVRGGSWGGIPRLLRSANRDGVTTGYQVNFLSFRVGRTF